MSDTDVQFQTVDINGSGTNTFQTTEFFEVDFRKRFLSNHFVCGTNSGFDYTTGSTEDNSGTC